MNKITEYEEALKGIVNLSRYDDGLGAATHIAQEALNATPDEPEQQQTTITITQLGRLRAGLIYCGIDERYYTEAMAVITDLDKKLDAGE